MTLRAASLRRGPAAPVCAVVSSDADGIRHLLRTLGARGSGARALSGQAGGSQAGDGGTTSLPMISSGVICQTFTTGPMPVWKPRPASSPSWSRRTTVPVMEPPSALPQRLMDAGSPGQYRQDAGWTLAPAPRGRTASFKNSVRGAQRKCISRGAGRRVQTIQLNPDSRQGRRPAAVRLVGP